MLTELFGQWAANAITVIWLSSYLVWGFSGRGFRLRRIGKYACITLPFLWLAAAVLAGLNLGLPGAFIAVLLWPLDMFQTAIYAIPVTLALIPWRLSGGTEPAKFIAMSIGVSLVALLAIGVPFFINRAAMRSIAEAGPQEIDKPLPKKPRKIVLIGFFGNPSAKPIFVKRPKYVHCNRFCALLLMSGEVDEVIAVSRHANPDYPHQHATRYTVQRRSRCLDDDSGELPEEIGRNDLTLGGFCLMPENGNDLPPAIQIADRQRRLDEPDDPWWLEVSDARQIPAITLLRRGNVSAWLAAYPLQLTLTGWVTPKIVGYFVNSQAGTSLDIETVLKQKLGYSLKPLPKYLKTARR